jgi:polyhydroxybutyrate depolymerase
MLMDTRKILLAANLAALSLACLAQLAMATTNLSYSRSTGMATAPLAERASDEQVSKETIYVQGKSRMYLLFHPSAAIERAQDPSSIDATPAKFPLVIVFHGSYSGSKGIMNYTQLNKLAENKGFFVAYPTMNFLYLWNLPRQFHNPDVEYVGAMIEHLKKTYPIDPARIYGTGYSTGADFLQLLACNPDLSAQIAAYAPVCSNLDRLWAAQCQKQRPIAILLVNGTSDRLNRWQGNGKRWMSVPETFKFWADHNGSQPPNEEVVENKDWKEKDSKAVLLEAQKAGSRPEVAMMKIYGGGHTWPGAKPKKHWIIRTVLGTTHRKDDANQVMWDFFERNPLR